MRAMSADKRRGRVFRSMRGRGWASVVTFALLAGCKAQPPPPATPASAAAAPPLWLVTIVVDQMAAWMADERWNALPSDGGFARLLREGTYVRELRFAHSNTETAPGHAALYTGVTPRVSGIVGNDVLGPDGKKASSLLDASTRLVPAGAAGPIDRRGSSLAALKVDTLADALVAARPGAEVYSLSLKDRGALFGGGRHPKLVLWLDTEGGTLVTSTAFAQAVPAWAAPFADGAAVARACAQPWEPLDAGWLAAQSATRDDQEGEGDYQGMGTTFPHRAPSAKAMRATPAGDRLLLDLARAAAAHAAETSAGRPVLIAVSLSSHDYVNHVFGPGSWESWDELRRLDRGLAELLAALDTLAGPGGYAVMLTGDHGSNPLPEIERSGKAAWCRSGAAADYWQRACGRGSRLNAADIARKLDEPRTLIAGIIDPFVYLTDRGRALPPVEREALRKKIEVSFAGSGDIAQVMDVRTAPATCPPSSEESLAALTCRSVRLDQAGDFYLVAAPGTFFDPDLAAGRGTNHGSPYLYDRAVPLIVRAPGRVPAGMTVTQPTSFATFARTAASLLAIPEPRALADSDAPDLTKLPPTQPAH
jgi:Type I phosphodiesterase / nucleotide pyrophosphatase